MTAGAYIGFFTFDEGTEVCTASTDADLLAGTFDASTGIANAEVIDTFETLAAFAIAACS